MPFSPLTDLLGEITKVRLIATDMDGTLTQQDKFTPQLLSTLESLAQIPLPVIIVTGRSAGWVEAIRYYLPIAGAIAENGGVFYHSDQESSQLLTPIPDIKQHRQHLAETFDALTHDYPQLRESHDNRFRLTDWTFDVQGLSKTQLNHLQTLVNKKGWSFTYSTVQCHIKPLYQDKATSLIQILTQFFASYTPNQVLTIGDSPNDESLFDINRFPLSVGVANLARYREQLTHQPAYMTNQSEVDGFCEIAHLILKTIHNRRNI